MRQLKKNKQKMFYSKKIGWKEKYQTDSDGNIEYAEWVEDGVLIREPIPTGEKELVYDKPIEFWANINGKLNDAIVRAFGVDNSDNHAQIVCDKGAFDFNIGTRIWLKSAVLYTDSTNTTVDMESADYEVRGVLTEALNEDMYYLVVLNHEDKTDEASNELNN